MPLLACLLLAAGATAAPAAPLPPAAEPVARPRMVIEPPVYDAGTVSRGSPVNALFTVRNFGNEVLRLQSVHPG